MASRVVSVPVQHALMRRERPRRSLIFGTAGLPCCLTLVTLITFISFATASNRSNVRLQTTERASPVNVAGMLPTDVTVAQPNMHGFAKYVGSGGADQSSLLPKAHAAYVQFSGTPYTGAAINLPGRIESENFDDGGEGVAYHDSTSTNDGGFYRSQGVDICTCGSPYGLSVGWTQPGEWMEYTVTVSSYGTYKFQTHTATIVTGSALHIEVDGLNVTGQMILPNTGAWGSYAATPSPAVTLTAGQHIIRVAVDVSGFLIDSVDVIRLNTPFGGTATVLPGTIPAENFDNGGEGIAFHDTTSANEGGAYRLEAVDLCVCGYLDGAAIGWSAAGEWTKYTVNYSFTDTYTLKAKMSTIVSGCTIHLELDGVDVTGPMVLPNTGSWDTWTTVSKPNIQISGGQHELKMVIESGGFLLDSISVIPSVPSAPSGLAANPVSSSQINLAWTDNSFNETGFKVERKTGPSGTYSEIGTTTAGITIFSNTGLQSSTQYFYRVRATNLGGDSGYSNETTATTVNLLPSASITSPSAGMVVTAPANVTIEASASDPDGTVSKVELFQGSTKLGEDLSAPYSFNWTNVTAGTYSVSAKATDNLGGTATSAPVSITVNSPPTISLTAPTANTVVHSPADVTITASAFDSDGSVAKVEFFQNGLLLGEDTTPPYSYIWSSAPIGTFSLTARSTDNRNATSTSSAVTVIVNNRPNVSISAPAANSTFITGSVVSVAATATDTDGTINKVEFYQGATKLGEDLVSPFTFEWSNVQQGSYSMSAVATDDRGASKTTTVIPINVVSSSMPRLDPMNRTGGSGENPLSRNFNWQLPLVSLPGRAGMDLNLTLAYNSLVWTKVSSNIISFDDDQGFPSAGFRLGLPEIQPIYYNSEVGKNAYLLIGADGDHVELRQVGTSGLYEAADSSHLLLDTSLNLPSPDTGKFVLRTTDGTRMWYELIGGDYQCTQIKDRNGNYITINYNAAGHIDNIHDTLDRVITFNYDNGLLSSITQLWKKPSNPAQTITHTWASFSYADLQIQTNFSGLSVVGATNGSMKKVLSKVTLDDNSTTASQNSRYDFEYTSWGQVWKISNVAADNHVLNYRSYNLPADASNALSECPRFTERRDWAENWNRNVTGVEQEAVTTFSQLQTGTANVPGKNPQAATFVQVTNPNGTSSNIYFLGTPGTDTGWQVGLPYLVDTYDCLDTNPANPCTNSALVRQMETLWTQDDETNSQVLNPRVAETNVYDPSGNRKRTRMVYESFSFADGTSCHLPKYVHEYKSVASNYLRTTEYSYVDHTNYAPRRILGLVSDRRLRDGNENGEVVSWVSYSYDESGSIDAANTPIMHDAATYGPGSIAGRGNLTSVTKHNVSTGATSTSTFKYDRAGSVVSSKDPLNHEVKFGYADNFSDSNNSRQTFAYLKTVTDPDNFITTTLYNFDFGGVVSTQIPKPNSVSYQAGPVRTTVYDDLGRIERTTNSVNGAYTRYQYSSSGNRLDAFSTLKDGASQQNGTEGQSFVIFDGLQRVIGMATKRAAGGFNGQRFEYDVMGRKVKTSNPSETSALGSPLTWAATGADQSTGWKFTEQAYDWKGRVIRTTNQDGTFRTATYTGCGCAGGEVVTLTDEGTIVSGVNKRRQQTLHHDVLDRLVKTEVWDFEGTAVDGVNRRLDSTTITTYNVRDQITLIKEYAGAEGASTFQETSRTYDGFGRLETQHMPHQRATANQSWTSDHTTFHYDAEDKLDYTIDARGVKKQFSYQNNNRHLVTGLSYDLSALPAGQTAVPAVAAATFEYNAAGLRKKMTDGTGSISYTYNDLAQLTSEAREFSELPGQTYTLNYEYELGGQLKRITDHNNSTIKYNYDTAGQLSEVVGEGNLTANVSNYASGFDYRAWSAMRSVSFGNGTNQQTEFNSRLKPTSGTLNGLVPGLDTVTWTYDYYEDGRQKHAYNSYDTRFDRLLEYDHVGRMKHAYSGREARGLAALTPNPDSPYQHTFTYDAFDNRTEKSGRFWRTPQTGVTPCLPRHDFDGCDSEGYVVNSGNEQHTYDAATRQVNFEDWQFTVGGSPNHPNVEPGVELNQTYDADGRPAKRIETRRSEELIGSGPQTNILLTETTTYFVYSTVLGGAKVIELGGGDGHVSTTYVYANGFRIAKQLVMSTIANHVVWNHVNPGSNSFVETFADKSLMVEERDPDGGEVGLFDPWANVLEEPTYRHIKDEEPLYLEGGNPFDFSEGLTIDGLPVTRSEFDRRMGNGSAGVEVSQGGRPVAFVTNTTRQTHITIDVYRVDRELEGLPQSQRWGGTYYVGSFDIDLGYTAPASFAAFNHPQAKAKNLSNEMKALVTDALKDCLTELYPPFGFVSFTPISANVNGAIRVKDLKSGLEADIVSDSTPPKDVVTALVQYKARGATDPKNPWWTYAVSPLSDPELRPGEKRYPELYLVVPGMDWVRTQIHEAGAALTLLRDMYYPGPWSKPDDEGLDRTHPDDGPAMENCVGKKIYAKWGKKPAK